MEDKDQEYNIPQENHFLSRGCCHPPQIYHDNRNIADHRCCKLDSYDWLKNLDLPEDQLIFDCVEIRFKNSRKEFFRVYPEMKLQAGDIVAVEATPGHDIGVVTLTGEAVRLQMRKKRVDPASDMIKKVYRRARLSDIEKWLNAVDLEDRAKVKARKMSRNLDLVMKINDVEYQGDETKAIFYYTADERVDFRELIKVLAEEFKVRIEMRQIGARQEAARLGGIGSCGRELCCSTWLTNFNSVSTNTARTQQLSLNPQKLAGQCGKLKCCLNYENDVYLDALADFPNTGIILKTKKGEAIYQKSDVFKKIMWYSYIDDQSSLMAITTENVFDIIEKNKKSVFPEQLEDFAFTREQKTDDNTSSAIEEEDISRFDKMEEKSSRKKGGQNKGRNRGNQGRRNNQNKQNTQGRDNNQRREGKQKKDNNQRRDSNQRRDNNQRKDNNTKRDNRGNNQKPDNKK